MTVTLSIVPHWKDPLAGCLLPWVPAGCPDSGVSSLRAEFLLNLLPCLSLEFPLFPAFSSAQTFVRENGNLFTKMTKNSLQRNHNRDFASGMKSILNPFSLPLCQSATPFLNPP